MRGALLICATALACGLTGLPTAGAASTTTAPPRASLEGFVCQRAGNQLDRAIEVVAVMRPLSGTQRMEMKFVLLKRPTGATGRFTEVEGRDLGNWLGPDPATLGQRPSDVWRLKKLVVSLPGGSDYRFRVILRWLGASGTDLGRMILGSPVCAQPQ